MSQEWRRQRARLREQLVAELASLSEEAARAEMSAPDLRGRLDDIMARYIPGAAAEMKGSLDELMREYEGLRDANARLAFLENLQRRLGG